MPRNVNASEKLVKEVIEAFGQADLAPLYAALDEKIIWKAASTIRDGKFIFGGCHEGRAGVVAHLSKLQTAYFFARAEAKEIVSAGEIVWCLFEFEANYVPRDGLRVRKPLAVEAAMRVTVRNGKILTLQTFFDTAALLVQQGELAAG